MQKIEHTLVLICFCYRCNVCNLTYWCMENLPNFFKPGVKLLQKNLSEIFSDLSGNFRKNSDRKISGKFFRKNVGNFFVRRPVRKPSKIPPGLFWKKGGLFVKSCSGNVCFLHKFQEKIRMVSLRIPVVSRKPPGGISPEIPGNSGGKIRGFFPVFSMFHGCNAGLTP